jgi:FdhE protein
MTEDLWLTRHPYLQPMADLQTRVEAALGEIPVVRAAVPHWDNYVSDFHNGIPLLHSPVAGIDLVPAESTIGVLLEKLVSRLPEKLAQEAKILNTELTGELGMSGRIIDWVLDREGCVTVRSQGLLRYLGWTVLGRYLRPLVNAFASWRDEERWLRNYCPTCGSRPAMGQLVGIDPGRRRFLACGRCDTRWWFQRVGCPFCDVENGHRLTVLTVEGESGLRIDYCDSCGGYLKTYDGQGSERILLADWTSIHLDVIACDRGLKRFGASLYEL